MSAGRQTDSAISAHAPLMQVIGWHLAWAVIVLLGAVAVASISGGVPPQVAAALVLGLIPSSLSLFLIKVDGPGWRTALLFVWAGCAGAACLLTGGVGGPLAAWCLCPLAAAAVLARSEVLARAAALSLTAGAVAAIGQVAGVSAPPQGIVSLGLGALGLFSITLGLGAGLIMARGRQREAARAREAARDMLEDVLDAQPHLILQLYPSGRVAHSFGAPPQGVVLRGLEYSLIDAARPEDRPMVRDALNTALSRGAAQVLFVSEQALDKMLCLDLRTVQPRGTLESRRLVGVLRDVTPEQARVDVLQTARADAEALAAGKSQFLAGMSHELRTPLNAIMGFSDIMRNRMFGDLPGKYVEYADLIHESGSHLLDLINDVLDMSKIEAQRYELSIEAMDAREPVSAALRILRLQADEVGVSLRAVLPATPPDVDADRRALKQIVLNLVSNALKFTPKGGSVTVTLATRGRDLELTVADTGVGIAEADLARLGRPYEQAGDAGKKAMGTGLGLSLVRAFAELHGGEMTIESRLGEGTAVTVRMPVVQERAPSPPAGGNVVAFAPQR